MLGPVEVPDNHQSKELVEVPEELEVQKVPNVEETLDHKVLLVQEEAELMEFIFKILSQTHILLHLVVAVVVAEEA